MTKGKRCDILIGLPQKEAVNCTLKIEQRKTKNKAKKILENSAEESAKEFLYESKVSQAIKRAQAQATEKLS